MNSLHFWAIPTHFGLVNTRSTPYLFTTRQQLLRPLPNPMKSLSFRSAREARNVIACPSKQSAMIFGLVASSVCSAVAQQNEPTVISQQPPAIVTQTPAPQATQPPSIRVSVPTPANLAPAPVVAATPSVPINATPIAQMTVPLAPQTIPAPAFEVYPDYNWCCLSR